MKICPQCREEYLDHIEICSPCNARLVHETEIDAHAKNGEMSRDELFQEETVAFLESGLAQCREIEKVLIKWKVPCAVYPVSLKCDDNPATLGTSCDMKYMVLVRVSDVENAKAALEGQFAEHVAKEGQGHFVKDAIDLSQEIITCPACNESNPLKDGECPNCGLCLGVGET